MMDTPKKRCRPQLRLCVRQAKPANAYRQRIGLDWTKAKPAAKSEVTIGKAEEFLASLLEEMNPKLKQVRKRLRDDFSFYAKSAAKIRTKEGDIRLLS